MKAKITAIILLVFLGFTKLNAQSDLMLYGYRDIPQTVYTNPAFIPDAKIFVAIPVLSSISNSTYSSSFSIDDLLKSRSGSDSLYLNPSSIINKNYPVNFISENLETDILGLGIKLNSGDYLSFGIRNRLYTRLFYSNDLINLLWNGNAPYLGQNLDLSNTIASSEHYLNWYAGFGFKIGENVSIGLRVNYLQGLSSIQTEKSNLSLTTNADSENVYSIKANTAFLVNTSGFSGDSINGFTASDYILNFNNSGFSFDFGADFKVSENVNLSFSVLDIGKINWKSNLKSYESTADSVDFSGIYADFNNPDGVFNVYADSLAELIDVNEFKQNFSSSLPTRFYLGLEIYSNQRKNRFSFVFNGTMLKKKFSPAVSLAYDMKVSKHFTFKLAYSWLQYSPINFGTAFTFKFKPFQFYFLSDNIFSTFMWDKQRYFNFRLGLNIKIPSQNRIPTNEPVFTK